MIYGNWNFNSREFLDDIVKSSKNSEEILFVSGFSSIGFFAYLFKEIYLDKNSKTKSIKFILGNEIYKSSYKIQDSIKNHYKEHSFDYYYFPGIELLKTFIENKSKLNIDLGFSKDINLEIKIETGNRNLHAKIFLYDNELIFGSSNLSYSGTVEQLEINKKVLKKNEETEFNKVKSIALAYWNSNTAIDYKKELLEVFNDNISISNNFEESMILFQDNFINGNWFKSATHKYQNDIYDKLWVHQKRSVSQALKILERDGAVIIAEPTGSGKTKIAATVLRYLYDKYSEINNLKGEIVVVCPPNVETEWTEEIKDKYKINGVNIISSGIINQIDKPENISHLYNLKNAKILLLDEAHTFANLETTRGKNLLFNNYTDYIIMLTATPLNKVINDYKGLIMQIGGDCLEEEQIINLNNDIFIKNPEKYVFDLDNRQKELYKNAISSITVRKTKEEINKFSKENKSKTLTGKYPDEITKDYSINFNSNDIICLRKIISLSKDLKGLSYLNKNLFTVKNPKKELAKIRGLAKHFLIYNLRSSKVALIEHIKGTFCHEIKHMFDYEEINKQEIKGKIYDLKKFKDNIKWNKNIDWDFIWKSKKDFDNDIDKEINIYQEILNECLKMNDIISQSKIDNIFHIMSEKNELNYKKCIVFDKIPLSVLYLEHLSKKQVEKLNLNYLSIAIIGENKNILLNQFKELFGLNKGKYKEINCIGFASNILSESVNLQGADSMLFSDIPLTPTTAEQRIGRISRMNSPYEKVSIYWPDLPNELFLNTDRLLVYRFHNIAETIKSNIEIPKLLKSKVVNQFDSKLNAKDLKIEEEELELINELNRDFNDENENEKLSDEGIFDFEEELKGFLKDSIEIEDSFEKLNKFFINLLGKNKSTNIHYRKNLYNFITIKNKLNKEWGLFVISTNLTTTPQIVFFDKTNHQETLSLNNIVNNLSENIDSINNVKTLSLIKQNISEDELSQTMSYYNEEIEKLFSKSSNVLYKKHNKAFGRFKDWLLVLKNNAINKKDKNLVRGYEEIIEKIENAQVSKQKISQKWFNFFMEEWVKYIKEEFEKNKNRGNKVFNGSVPLYEDFSTDKMYRSFKESSPEEIYFNFLSDSDNENYKQSIKFKIRFAVICFDEK